MFDQYPEINDLSVEGLKQFRREKRNKKINDVLWSIACGAGLFLGFLWAWNVYQLAF